jgi:uncharacterized protein YdiU (UPF0061 family)
MTLHIPFDNTYARLPARFFHRQPPAPSPAPRLIAVNGPLARALGLDPEALASPQGLEILAGNATPDGAEPLAQAYAGHQFGGWVPALGDGRALLLGEVATPQGRFDIQLKGSGPTPFSRRGDGRAWLGPVVREYLVSEAMNSLGIPTTRALAAVTTGDTVWREAPLPGAILARVAASHIRVGTFQYFAARGDTDALNLLTNHVISRHYPDAATPLDLIRAVTARQARLIAHWMAVGFVHGVMNTDNMAVSGETIDYGPCAFLDAYHPMKVFSSIDQHGRYAYGNQPQIALWNLAQFASCLLPLIDAPEAEAVEEATAAIDTFRDIYQAEWSRLFRAKIGLATEDNGDLPLIERLLDLMADQQADFTRTFRGLADGTARDEFADRAAFDAWSTDWQARLAREPGDPQALMARTNPALIPRNHRIEQAIRATVDGDFAPFHRLNAALARPFNPAPEDAEFARAPLEDETVRRTFCGT